MKRVRKKNLAPPAAETVQKSNESSDSSKYSDSSSGKSSYDSFDEDSWSSFVSSRSGSEKSYSRTSSCSDRYSSLESLISSRDESSPDENYCNQPSASNSGSRNTGKKSKLEYIFGAGIKVKGFNVSRLYSSLNDKPTTSRETVNAPRPFKVLFGSRETPGKNQWFPRNRKTSSDFDELDWQILRRYYVDEGNETECEWEKMLVCCGVKELEKRLTRAKIKQLILRFHPDKNCTIRDKRVCEVLFQKLYKTYKRL